MFGRVKNNHNKSVGKLGEDLAVVALKKQGYRILARNYRQRYGEIDIIAQDGETLVFVEVKTRRTRQYGSPLEAVTLAKQRQISRVALDYITRRKLHNHMARFDVVSVMILESASPQVEVLHDCFEFCL